MSFDKNSSERARWEDALDRLRDLRDELRKSRLKQDYQRDLWLRGWSLVSITLLVTYAVYQL